MQDSSKSNSVGLVKPNKVHFDKKLVLASGSSLNGFDLVYETYGELNTSRSNAILICHALSGDHHVAGYHSSEDKFFYHDAGNAFCLYGVGVRIFRGLCLYGDSSFVHLFGTTEVVGSIEFVLGNGRGITGYTLFVSAHRYGSKAAGHRWQSGGGAAFGYRYR